MASPDHQEAHFEPLQLASKPGRLIVTFVGPLLWLIAIIVVTVVVYGRDAVEIGLTVTFVAFIASLVISWIGRRLRLREEREAETG